MWHLPRRAALSCALKSPFGNGAAMRSPLRVDVYFRPEGASVGVIRLYPRPVASQPAARVLHFISVLRMRRAR